jgi:transcriptional regulator with XRE-family HTH domain
VQRRHHHPELVARAVGQRVRELRLARELTQEKLAERLGVATPHVQAVERGVRNVTLATLCRLADALHVEVIQLFVAPRTDHVSKPGRPKASQSVPRGTVPVAVYEREELPSTHTIAERPPEHAKGTGRRKPKAREHRSRE